MRRKTLWLLVAVVGAGALALAGPLTTLRTEEAPYQVIGRIGDVEIRRYAPQIRAVTRIEGSWREAGNEGFRRLAAYIFGQNTRRADIAMTVPVETAAPATSIAMTAPVETTAGPGGRTMRFVMPSDHTLATLPAPSDPRVTLEPVGERTMAALRFSGLTNDRVFAERRAQLLEALRRADLAPVGEAVLARYDPPWTLPLLRRNEVLVPLVG